MSNWISVWKFPALAASVLVLAPVAVIASGVFQDSEGVWGHLLETRLAESALNTIVVLLGACLGALALAVPSAWVVTMYQFPGRRLFAWALMLPIAVPAYVSAYALTDLLQFSGPLQTPLRAVLGDLAPPPWLFQVRSVPGAIMVMAASLYPYVYLASRVAFASQSQTMLDASRSLGSGPWATFWRVGVPLARPSIAAATALVAMETVAEFGAMQHCAVDTLTTEVYRAWLGHDSQVAAKQISTALLALVLTLVVAETWSRSRIAVHNPAARSSVIRVSRLRPTYAAIAIGVCLLPITLGFALPVSRLAVLAVQFGDQRPLAVVVGYGFNSLRLAVASGMIAALVGTLVMFHNRLHRDWVGATCGIVVRTGYAIPGPVVAIGVLVTLGWLDRRINGAWMSIGSDHRPLGLVLSGSVAALIVSYQTRFLGIASGLMEAASTKLGRRVDEAARTLGASSPALLGRVVIPNVRAAMLASMLLVLVDVMKELPATLMLRPFNFDTLAVRVYELASEERLDEAATGALLIVGFGLLPVLLLSPRLRAPAANHEHATSGASEDA